MASWPQRLELWLLPVALVSVACGSSPRGVAAPAPQRGPIPSEPAPAPTPAPPLSVAAGLFDPARPDDLGLPTAAGTETFTIFRPTEASDHFSNGVALAAFQGWLYAQWQSSATDEDARDTWTVYSRSRDGKEWSAPLELAARNEDRPSTSGGLLATKTALVAYLNVWPSNVAPRGGFTEVRTSSDGLAWSSARPLAMADGAVFSGIFEQDPRALPGGRVLGAAHFQPGLTLAPCYTDDPSGTRGWKRAAFSPSSRTEAASREIEPSFYRRGQRELVMILRDQQSSFRKLAAVSQDDGETWSAPLPTDVPDSRSKQSAGNLPDGSAYFVSNPVSAKRRMPLVVALSRDGHVFDRAFVLRKGGSDLQAQRYPGKAKTLGYSYPKSLVADGYLYVGYSTNKEDVEITRVPLKSLLE